MVRAGTPIGRHSVPLLLKVAVSVVVLAVLLLRLDAARLWLFVQHASLWWLAAAFGVYAANVVIGSWRWQRLMVSQGIAMDFAAVAASVLVAAFLNNFLPSNLGRDVVRVRDSSRPAGSLVLAATVVLADRVVGLITLVLVSAIGATVAVSRAAGSFSRVWPSLLWASFALTVGGSAWAVARPGSVSRLLQPFVALRPQRIEPSITQVTTALGRFGRAPGALAACCGAALVEQAAMVCFYIAVARALQVRVAPWDLAVVVPIATLVQMVPVSMNGLGVREATFSLFFAGIGLPASSGLVVSLVAHALVMLASVSGALVWLVRGRQARVRAAS
jgi:glycosyltransferase 2 family protein